MLKRIFAKKYMIEKYILVVAAGILLRFIVMSLGHNYDFQSYLIVGDLRHHGLDVYANTERYNYGPLFMLFQGLFYEISTHAVEVADMYRVLIVSMLTITDIGIMLWLGRHYGKMPAVLFFLNPVSIIITGYHNQFDNMAILLMLLASSFYNEEKQIRWKDAGFVICMSLSLIMKHIFFVFPVWLLLSRGLPLIKRALYAFVPPSIFLLSFVGPVLKNPDNLEGILQNVFFYRSFNNTPLLKKAYEILHVPESLYTMIFMLLVAICGYLFREKRIEERLLWYLMCLVAFSSAIANQYLAIPMAALCVFGKKLKYVYMILMGHYLIWNSSGMDISSVYPEKIRIPESEFWGYFVACLILAVLIIAEVKKMPTRSD